MDEKSDILQSSATTTAPAPAHNLRESLLRRVTPHFLPQAQGQQQANGQQIEEKSPSRPQSRIDELKRNISYIRPTPRHAVSNIDYPEERLVTHEDKLSDFRRLVGIDSSPSHTLSSGYHRAAENVGIYTHVVKSEAACMSKYKQYSILINMSLGMQLIFSAALTALGAGDGPRTAVTAFGAINTVLAGILTFLKGSGLPNREKYYAGEWRKVRDHIEQREREFGRIGCPFDVDEEMREIEAMYHGVKQDVEANTPDGFTSVAAKTVVKQFSNTSKPGSNPRNLEAGYGPQGQSTLIHSPTTYNPSNGPPPPPTGIAVADHRPNLLSQISSHVDPSSKAGHALDKLSALQAKYGDSILDKITHLSDHGDHNDPNGNPHSTLSRNLSSASTNLIDSTQRSIDTTAQNLSTSLSAAGLSAQRAGESVAADIAAQTALQAAQARDSLGAGVRNLSSGLERQVQLEAERLAEVGRHAQDTAGRIGGAFGGLGRELSGVFGRGSGQGVGQGQAYSQQQQHQPQEQQQQQQHGPEGVAGPGPGPGGQQQQGASQPH